MESSEQNIRKAAVAGTFYPADPAELAKTIAGFYSEVDKIPVENDPLALIVPHAGYPYSGRTAAKAFKLLEGRQYETVVIIAPSHTVFFKGSSVFEGDGYETPLGIVEIDKELSQKIAEIHPSVYFSNMGHSRGEARSEHALEVHLPFLQIILGKFKLVAIVMGDQEEDSINSLAETLATALKDSNSLIIASTDLSHFHSEEKARELDGNIQKAIEKFDPELLIENLDEGKGEACGGGIVASVLKAAKRLKGERVEFLEYTTSGATTGEFTEVVGYLSAAVIAGKSKVAVNPMIGIKHAVSKNILILTDEGKQQLLDIAKSAIRAQLDKQEYIPPKIEEFKVKRGLFVTLKLNGLLRGCIGLIKANKPLFEAVAEMAQAAAFEDPRFPTLTDDEFNKLEYEISILSPLKLVHDIRNIKVGRDGLMIQLHMHSGLLLPQVARDYEWDTMTFLEQTCLKAGLPKNSYRDKDAQIFNFKADIF